MGDPDLSVVIPSWNGARNLEDKLPSVLMAARVAGDAEVVVADDASRDDTADLLARRFPGVRLVRRETNGGFALNANAGIAAARGRVVLLLNNDVAVRPDAAQRLLEALDVDPGTFAVVPSIVRVRSGVEEALTRIRYRRGVVSTAIDGTPDRPPDYACGGAMAFERERFRSLGGFDPLFGPFYWEDVDLSYRARKRGGTIRFVASARVDHDHGSTIGVRFERRRIVRVYERNRLLFTWKNLHDRPLWRAHLALLGPKLAWDLVAHRAFVAGFADALALRRRIFAARRAERAASVVADRELLKTPQA